MLKILMARQENFLGGKALRYTFVVGTSKEGQAHVKVMWEKYSSNKSQHEHSLTLKSLFSNYLKDQ